ncbi:PAS domain-containing protein [Cysteiniphilum halobium]|uniref:PAS domain-containing protein n=1 Tax=Cysteiniphilum halobium TaxID=2219059 RepID=UPI000E652AB8|nr:PAS domain-containing protein [Cysteiniphilum halobium]
MSTNTDATPEFESFAELIPEPVYWLDLKQRIIGFSSSATKAAGIESKEQVLGKTPYDLYPKKMADKIISHHREVIKTGKKLNFEESIVDKKYGKLKIFDATIIPLYDANKNIIGTSGISIDITERKRLEEETIKQKNQLEKKLAFQRNYIRSYGYEWIDALKNISLAINTIGEKLIESTTIPESLEIAVNNQLYKINESLSEMYTMYQKINSTIISEDEDLKHTNQENSIPMYLEDLIAPEIGIANALINAKYDVKVSFEMDEQSKQKLNVDCRKLRHIIRTLLANYTKGINKHSLKSDINLKITGKDGVHNKLYVTFEFKGNMPFLELENDTIRAEYLMYEQNNNFAMDRHGFAYELALAKHYTNLLCKGDEQLIDYLFEGSNFSFTLPFLKIINDEEKY